MTLHFTLLIYKLWESEQCLHLVTLSKVSGKSQSEMVLNLAFTWNGSHPPWKDVSCVHMGHLWLFWLRPTSLKAESGLCVVRNCAHIVQSEIDPWTICLNKTISIHFLTNFFIQEIHIFLSYQFNGVCVDRSDGPEWSCWRYGLSAGSWDPEHREPAILSPSSVLFFFCAPTLQKCFLQIS